MKPVCVECEVEFVIDRNGVVIEEMAFVPPEPYLLWRGDRYVCPKCGRKIIIGIAKKSFASRHDDDFAKVVEFVEDKGVHRVYVA